MAELGFAGRVAIVTGAGRGLGREYALLLAGRGAAILVNDRGVDPDGAGSSATPAESVAQDIVAAGGRAVANADSVASEDGARSIVAAALEAFGRVDILVNNAGVMNQAAFEDTTIDVFTRQMDVSFFGTVHMTRACWPHLIRNGGNVVNISSAGMLGKDVLTAYASAKGAVFAFTRSLALCGASHGVKVNAVMPLAATRMVDVSGTTIPNDEVRQFVLSELAPRKVAPVVAYLAHRDCKVSGRAFTAGRDRVALVFLAETEGIRRNGLDVEDVAANIEAICDTGSVMDFADQDAMLDWLMRLN